jgi:hypothetical protein
MPRLDFSLTAPFALDDVVVRVGLEGGAEIPFVMRRGRLVEELAAKPITIRLSGEAQLEGRRLELAPSDEPGTPAGTLADARLLFEHGWDVPADGTLALQLTWGAHCHGDGPPDNRRFASIEHMRCADLVGLDEQGAQLVVAGIVAPFTGASPLPCGNKELTFAQIVALGGDFYAHFDDAAGAAFAWAWPEVRGLAGWVARDYRAVTLAGDAPSGTEQLLAVIERDRDRHPNVAGEFARLALDAADGYPARRYLALSSQNVCHFACPEPGGENPALALYEAYHARAIAMARAAQSDVQAEAALRAALAVDAFGCHFLSDLFASGHMRVPRRVLSKRYGILRGALHMSLRMHNEDNEAGLWCTTRTPTAPRRVWRAFGDGMLAKDEAACHLRQVQEAVRRSAEEIFRAYCGAEMPPGPRAVDLVPQPLPPGDSPDTIVDVPPEGCPWPTDMPNGWPMYAIAPSGRVIERAGTASENRYRYVDGVFDVPPEDRHLMQP